MAWREQLALQNLQKHLVHTLSQNCLTIMATAYVPVLSYQIPH